MLRSKIVNQLFKPFYEDAYDEWFIFLFFIFGLGGTSIPSAANGVPFCYG